MPNILMFDAFTLLIHEKNVANYALLRCKTFSLKIWLCKNFDKFNVCNTKTDKRCWPKSGKRQQLAIFYPRWCNSNAVNRELIHHHYHSENHSVAIRTNFTTLWVINRVAIRWSGSQKIIYQIPLSEGGVCMKHENVPFSLNQRTKLLIISINMKLILY